MAVIKIDDKTHRRLKRLSSVTGRPMTELVEEAVRHAVQRKMGEETLQLTGEERRWLEADLS